MKKKCLIKVFAALIAFFCCSALHGQSLIIWQKDGSQVVLNLNQLPKTTFTEKDMVIKTIDGTTVYPLSSIQRYTYDIKSSSGIKQSSNDKYLLYDASYNIIQLFNYPSGMDLFVYSVDGKQYIHDRSNGEKCQTISLKKLPIGTYVIHINEVTYKITKK